MSMQGIHYTRDFTMGDIAGGQVQQSGGKTIAVFFTEGIRNEVKSTQLGRPVFDAVEMVRLLIPGDPRNSPVSRVSEEHIARFPGEYKAFRAQEEFSESGTRIDDWSVLTQAQRYSLKAMNLFTVEQIANLSDEQMQNIGMGARQLRDRAKMFLEVSEKGAVPERVAAELEAKDKQVAHLTAQVAQLADRLEAVLRKSGADVALERNPIMDARAAVQAAVELPAAPAGFVVPENYKSLGFRALRDMCENITVEPVSTKEDAFAIIERYLGKKAAAR